MSAEANVQTLQTEPSALRWMEGRAEPPKYTDKMRLSGGGPMVGWFWVSCNIRRKCDNPPYDRLLTNSVLRADYSKHSAARQMQAYY